MGPCLKCGLCWWHHPFNQGPVLRDHRIYFGHMSCAQCFWQSHRTWILHRTLQRPEYTHRMSMLKTAVLPIILRLAHVSHGVPFPWVYTLISCFREDKTTLTNPQSKNVPHTSYGQNALCEAQYTSQASLYNLHTALIARRFDHGSYQPIVLKVGLQLFKRQGSVRIERS